jgi:Uma2 family endonuclease
MLSQRRLTIDEFVELVENNPERHFKFNAAGEVIEATPEIIHSWIQVNFGADFVTYFRAGGLPGYTAVSELLHDLDGWPCIPDVAVVRMDSDPIPSVAPLVVVEIKSDSNSLIDLREKARKYLEHGTQMALLLIPEKRIVEVYQAGADVQLLPAEDTLEGGPVLRGFSVRVAELFPTMG